VIEFRFSQQILVDFEILRFSCNWLIQKINFSSLYLKFFKIYILHLCQFEFIIGNSISSTMEILIIIKNDM